jgi:hypothetical protein
MLATAKARNRENVAYYKVTRDVLAGQYIGQTAPKPRGVLKQAMGGVLLTDKTYIYM